jgi:RHH-type proline utilization regulon transcriptional repressor/proline dehydrogenase/delta 1-pyrroline-5-carboxylate dehydrogenase
MTTGAIVMRQPFGGMGKSAIGSGRKAGGFNYCTQFMNITSDGTMLYKSTKHPLVERLESLLHGERYFFTEIKEAVHVASHFASFLYDEYLQEHDYANIRGEENLIRYIPIKSVLLRFEEQDSLVEILVSIIAAKMSKAKLLISLPETPTNEHIIWILLKIDMLLDPEDKIFQQDRDQLIDKIQDVERLRCLQPHYVTKAMHQEGVQHNVHIAAEPFVAHGRLELMHYFLEQSISDSYHRYGNLGYKNITRRA